MSRGIPITDFLDIQPVGENIFCMPFMDKSLNHVGTIHAAAQFTLAELASGAFLETRFPEYKGRVFAVVRNAECKYRRPGDSDLVSEAEWFSDSEKVESDLRDKKKCLASVKVRLKNKNGEIVYSGKFEWYIQVIDESDTD